MAEMTDKIIPTMVTSVSHDKVAKVTYPMYRIVKRSYNEVARLIESGHRVELNDQGMIVILDKDKLVKQIAPLYNIELGTVKGKGAVETTTVTGNTGAQSTGGQTATGSNGQTSTTTNDKKDEKLNK